MPDHYSFIRQYNDFEELTATLHGYDIDLQQLDRGQFTATTQQVVSGAVLLSHFIATRRLEVHGNSPANLRTFGIPAEECRPIVWGEQLGDNNTILVYRNGTELEIVSLPFSRAIDLSIPEDTLNQQCQTLGYPEIDAIIGDNKMLTCTPKDMHTLRSALYRVCLALSDDPSLIGTIGMQQEIELELPQLLLSALCSAKAQPSRSTPERKQRALKKAVDYIKTFSNSPITLNELCQETQVSARTLQSAFLDHFGMSPKAYLRVQRLNAAHKELFTASPVGTKVADVACRRGFWHMGQFAADYKRLFRELPSETLKKQ